MGSGGSKTTTTVQNNDPWGPSQDYLKANMKTVSEIPQLQAYDQSMVVPFSSQSIAGMAGMENAANNATGVLNKPLDMYGGMMDTLGAEANGQISPALDAVLKRSTEDAMTAANLSASASGRYGGGMHSEALGRGIADATNNAVLGQMNSARGQLLNYGNALPGAYDASLAPYQTMLNVGQLNEAQSANQLNDAARIFQEQQNLPFEDAAKRNAVYTGAGQLGGSGYATATTPGTSFGQTALGYGLMGLGSGK